MLVAESRGVEFKMSRGFYHPADLFVGADKAQSALSDIADWLQFDHEDAYLDALRRLRARIFRRAEVPA